MFDRERQRRPVLIVGSGDEAALVASFMGATRYTETTKDRRDHAVWVGSLSDIDAWIRSINWGRVIIEAQSAFDPPAELTALAPVTSTHDELEHYFGRVKLNDRYLDTISSGEGVSVGQRVVEVVVAMLLLVPVLVIAAIFYLAFWICGIRRVLARQAYIGEAESEIRVISIAPTIPETVTSKRFFVARSLERQVRRLHLVFILGLFNVIRGDMALVGPSLMPCDDYHTRFAAWPAFRLRTLVRPGLVSLSRARLGKALTEYDQRRALEYDLYYIKHRCWQLDLRIAARAAFILVLDLLRTMLRIVRTFLALVITGTGKWLISLGSDASRVAAPAMPEGYGSRLTPVLVVGGGSAGQMLVHNLQGKPELGMWPVAIVDDDARKLGKQIGGVPILGSTDAMQAIVAREGIDAVVIAIPSAGEVDRQRIAQLAQATGRSVHSIPSLPEMLSGTPSTQLVDVQPSDLLGRPVVEIDPAGALDLLQDEAVLITGAAGSIGSEVVTQALRGLPRTIYGLDINESDLYDLQQDLRRRNLTTEFIPIVGSVSDLELVRSVMERFRPSVVFHAAAYKHVPLMESYPREALKTNISGTWNVVTASAEYSVDRFVMVSTDKAVRPSSVMGASKRLAELIVREVAATTGLSACSVRFGNVLGSRGSVIPLFKRQIAAGGPVTITDERMTRYFMTIPEAAGLIIEAGAFGDSGVVYMLDMDEPVRIMDVAERLIRLQGFEPGVDIRIEVTGLRPGEKLFEDLALDFEEAHETRHPKIRVLNESLSPRDFSTVVASERLMSLIDTGSPDEIRREIMNVVGIADGDNPFDVTPEPMRQA